ncbi:MAG: cobalt ECF transporter T component CbiQ [Deltaproteobacteria bacterium]|nr:cobalt ECF transporter T component CbiQ [Deltaproteobacteria bacterium]MBW2149974.1 cobalt ECF transporter T component CbiQ [Deltaproteobacteria bacterium]
MIQESFTTGHAQIHRLDPRLKVLFATLYSFIVALSDGFLSLFAALVLSSLLIGLARLNIREVAKRVVLVNGLILLFWLVLPLTFDGEALFYLGPFAVSREGVLISARITLKSNAILLAFIALIASTSITTLVYALNRLYIPRKLVHLFLLTYRYMFVIEQEYQRLVRAAKIRGFCPGNNLHTYRTYAYLIGMLFVRASARAERVHEAMLCRGFKGKFYCLHEFSLSRQDLIWSAFMAIAVIGLGILEWVKIT